MPRHPSTATPSPPSSPPDAWVVTWWEGETRAHRVLPDESAATRARAILRANSQALAKTSLEPIRLLPQRVFLAMDALRDQGDTLPCRHRPRLLRLCLPCLEDQLSRQC